MSKYTTQVRFICETAAGLTESAGFSDVNRIIQSAIPNIFNFDFPIYDESYRNVLCTKILKHYYTREIGAETVGLWKLWLDARLNEIMPYYNQLYKSAMIDFNPLYDIDLTTKHTVDTDGTTDVTGTITNTNQGNSTRTTNNEGSGTKTQNVNNTENNVSRDMYSDTPQGALDNLENETYLTNARKITNNGTSNSENTEGYNDTSSLNETVNNRNDSNGTSTGKTIAKSTEEYVQTITGKSGGASYSKRLMEFRSTFLNIDAMIIDELKDLFMNLW